MIDLNKVADECYNTAYKRELNGANINVNTMAMLKHCATEVIEATESYASVDISAEQFEKELADIICCALIIASRNDINIEKALSDVMEKNRLRAEGKGDKP